MHIRFYMSGGLFPKLHKALTEEMLCPKCGARNAKITAVTDDLNVKPRIRIDCRLCDYKGPLKKTLRDALAGWPKSLTQCASRIVHLTKNGDSE